jgi:hypothetical protein
MRKEFKLLFGDGQELPFFYVGVEEDGTTLDSSQQNRLFAFENDATIINISHLDYAPVTGSTYSAEENDFLDSDRSKTKPSGSDLEAFAYLVDGVLYSKLYINPGTTRKDQLIDALNQNPKIVRSN